MTSNAISLPHQRIAFQRRYTSYGSNWYEAHEDLTKKGLCMPTLEEFFALFREQTHDSLGHPLSQRRQQVYHRKLLKSNSRRHLEWLDAFFVHRDGRWYLHQRHVLQGSRLVPLEKIPLDTILSIDAQATIEHFDPLGFPLRDLTMEDFPFIIHLPLIVE